MPAKSYTDSTLNKLEIHYTPKHGSWLNIAEIELSHLSRQCLDRRMADQEIITKETLAWCQKRNNQQFVFTYCGKPIKQCNTKAWKKALKRVGIENFRWHDLRHTWASWHVQNGTSLQELQQLGGWSSFEMVLRYAHLSGDHLRIAADRIGSWRVAEISDNRVAV